MSVRIVLVSAAACLLLASSQFTLAQAPPAPSDADQRLKALENKMDRVLKLLEPRTPTPATPEALDRHAELLVAAKDTLVLKFEDAQQKLLDFRTRSPYLVGGKNTDASIGAQRLAKDEAVLQDLQQRLAEVAARTALVKNVGDVEKEARALLVLLQRRGVDVELLRRTAVPGRDETQTALDLVRLYGASLRQEAEELQHLAQAAEGRVERDRKMLREQNSFAVEEEKLRNTRDQTMKLLDVVIMQLQRIDLSRNPNAKP